MVTLLVACGGEDQPTQQKQDTTPAAPKTTSSAAPKTTSSQQQSSVSEPVNRTYQESINYIRIAEPTKNDEGKIEVVEVFWYGCPHCFATEPFVESWDKRKPQDVELIRVAAPLSGIWGFHAQVYYTNESLGITKQVHKATFNAIHQQNLRLDTLDQVADFYEANFGISSADYKNAFNSFGVDVEMKKAIELLSKYQINSVPVFVVGEAFKVDATSAGSKKGIFPVIDYLVRTQF